MGAAVGAGVGLVPATGVAVGSGTIARPIVSGGDDALPAELVTVTRTTCSPGGTSGSRSRTVAGEAVP